MCGFLLTCRPEQTFFNKNLDVEQKKSCISNPKNVPAKKFNLPPPIDHKSHWLKFLPHSLRSRVSSRKFFFLFTGAFHKKTSIHHPFSLFGCPGLLLIYRKIFFSFQALEKLCWFYFSEKEKKFMVWRKCDFFHGKINVFVGLRSHGM